MMKKRLLALMTVLALLCGSASALTLSWNELNDETYGAAVGAKVFSETLEQLSSGEMSIDLYLNGGLGDESGSLQGLQIGALDIFRGNASSLTDYGADIIGATGLPYLFGDMAEFERMAVSPLGQEILDSVAAADCGFIALSWLVEGPRNLFITQQTYERLGKPSSFSFDLMQGLNIRVPGSEIMLDTIEALGAHPIEIAYSSLITSLQSGNIDGAENGITTYLSMGFSEAAPYYIPDAHTFGCGVILVSTATWDSLTAQQQEWMQEAGKAASDACYAYNAQQEQACLEQFASRSITELPVPDLDRWQNACQELYARQPENVQTILTRIQNHDY